jgi:hypothetical protein
MNVRQVVELSQVVSNYAREKTNGLSRVGETTCDNLVSRGDRR